jgi:hypothetical protein
MMGGAAAALIECIKGRSEIAMLLPPGLRISERIRHYFDSSPEKRYEAIAKLCRLYANELDELFAAQNLDTIVQLSTRGMCRINGTLRDWEPDQF